MNDPLAGVDDIQWIPAREAFKKGLMKPPAQAQIDPKVSEIVGRPVLANDPELIRLVAKWKKDNGADNTDEAAIINVSLDNHLDDPAKRAELKKVFAPKTIIT